jgi:hypothetical protein
MCSVQIGFILMLSSYQILDVFPSYQHSIYLFFDEHEDMYLRFILLGIYLGYR